MSALDVVSKKDNPQPAATNGPQIVCCCCGSPATIFSPMCAPCAQSFGGAL